MKKNVFFVILMIVTVVVISCTQSAPTSSDKAMMEKKASESNENMEKNEMTEIGFEMKGGKMMMVDEKTKTESAMEKSMTLNDGTKVMTDGKVMKSDGTSMTLKEGESIWMDGTFMKAGEMMEEDEGMMSSSYKGKVLAGTVSKYLDFNKADYDEALKDNKKILLNFYANWCPVCKAEQPETFSAFNELNDDDVIGFRVNFKDSDTDDNEVELAKQFGVAYQHTKVILKDGKQVAKFPDSWNKQRYLDEISKVQ